MPSPDRPRRTGRARIRTTIGWREWVALPDLGVEAIKAKVDTGAATSSLHAWDIGGAEEAPDGTETIRFVIHPVQRDLGTEIQAVAPLVGWKRVRSSNGQVEERPVVSTTIGVGELRIPVDVTLTRRDEMGFRMLLGRSALRRRFLVDPGRSFLAGHQADPQGGTDKVVRS